MNLGRRPTSSSIRSGRSPLGVFWYVGGNKETRLNQTRPTPLAERTKRAFAVVGASCPVASLIVYFRQRPEIGGVSALATVMLPASVRSDAVTGPAKPPPARA